MTRKTDNNTSWHNWLDETFILLARYQAPEQKDEILPRAKQCPLRAFLPKAAKRKSASGRPKKSPS